MKKIAKLIGTFYLLPLLTACGGGGSASFTSGAAGGSTDTPGGTGQVNPPYTIVISFPQTDAVTKLTAEAGGVYSMSGTVVVTDQNGNAPPDGTAVQLDAIDSVLATGTIGAGDSLSGTTLTDTDPTDTNVTPNSVLFTTANVTRDGSLRFIQPGDLVLMLSGAASGDKNRFVAAAPSLMNSLEVTKAYTSDYPNTNYLAGSTQYVIGQSLIGVSILGIDESGNKTEGITKTKDGIGKFRIEYPANANTIHVGCNPDSDTRYQPTGSARTFVVARLSNDNVTTVSNEFCFFSILPWKLQAIPTSVSATSDIALTLMDAERVGLPFVTVSASVSGSASVTATGCTTVVGGSCNANINVSGAVSGDAATVTFYTDPETSITVDVAVP